MSLRSARIAASWASRCGSICTPFSRSLSRSDRRVWKAAWRRARICSISAAERADARVVRAHLARRFRRLRARETVQLVERAPRAHPAAPLRFRCRQLGCRERLRPNIPACATPRSDRAAASMPCSAAASRKAFRYCSSSARLRAGGVPFAPARRQRDAHLHVAAHHAALHQRADRRFRTDRPPRRVHLHVQAAMIQALHADHHFAVAERAADAGESGHAAQRRGHAIVRDSPQDPLPEIAIRATAGRCRPGSPVPRGVPVSAMRPRSSTTILSARRTVESRCAITITVRCSIRFCSARLHQHLRFRVQMRRGFVQNQDRRVLQQRPRDRQPLPLAAAQFLPALADDGVVAFRHPQNEFLGQGVARGFVDLFAAWRPARP